MIGRKTLLWTGALFISAGLFFLLLWNIGFSNVVRVFQGVRPGYLVISFFLYVLVLQLRGMRFSWIMGCSIPALSSLRVAALHQFYSVYVPFRLGEASFLVVARNAYGAGVDRSIPVLIVSRLFDLLCVALIGLTGLMFTIDASLNAYKTFFAVLAALTLIMALVLPKLSGIAGRKLKTLGDESSRSKLWSFGNVLVSASEMLAGGSGRYPMLVWYSVSSWLVSLVSFMFILLSLSYGFNISSGAVLFSLANLMGVLAFFTVAGIGVSEAGLGAAIALQGMDLHQAMAYGLGIRVAMIVLLAAVTLFIELLYRLMNQASD